MSEETSLTAEVQSARRNIEALRVALQSPVQEDVASSLPCIEEALSCLQAIQQRLADQKLPEGVRAGLEKELRALSQELDIAQRLVVHGKAFCESWGRMLAAQAGGYVSTGDPAPLQTDGSISVKA